MPFPLITGYPFVIEVAITNLTLVKIGGMVTNRSKKVIARIALACGDV